MRINEAAMASANFKRWRKATSLLATIERRAHYYDTHHRDKLQLKHLTRVMIAKWTLERYLETSLYIEEQDDDREINSSISSRKMINNPVKDTLAYIFEYLPAPTAKQYTDLEHALIETMNDTGKRQRVAAHKMALMYEIAYRHKQGWYIIFNTLTVDERNYHKVFNRDSAAFKNYIRTVQRACKSSHTYFAVVEEGGKTGRLHIHVVHLMQKLPEDAADPNKGRSRPVRMEIDSFRKYWQYGFSTPIAVRYSGTDAFSKATWRWPLDPKTGLQRKYTSPLALAQYLSKYILKSYEAPRRDKLLWRIRKSHALGRPLLLELLSTLTAQDLLNVATNDSLTTRLNNRKIPPTLLRTTALRLYEKSYAATGLTIGDLGKGLTPRPSPLTASRASNQNAQTSSLQNITATRIEPTDLEASFDETAGRLKTASDEINAKYFAQPQTTYGSTTTADIFG